MIITNDLVETVLGRLLKAHPDLMRSRDHSSGNWSMRTLLPRLKTKYERWITRILTPEPEATSGATSSPEAAWEILEEAVEPVLDDLKRHIELGLEAEALGICKGMVLGLYRLSEREGGDVLGWASDFPAEAAGNALEFWHAGADEQKRRDIRRKTRLPLPQDFLSMVPK